MTFIPQNPYEFLSEEDIETGKLSDEELSAYWAFGLSWLRVLMMKMSL
jgi:hypothetical protein